MKNSWDLTIEERAIFDLGVRAAAKFSADPYRDLYQDVFKAETSQWKLQITYDDVTGEYYLSVNFKHRDRSVDVAFSSHKDVFARVTRFMAKHPAPVPRCLVDY